LLNLADKKQRKKLIKCSNKDQIFCICEIVLNLLKGNIPVKKSDFEKLEKEKHTFRKLIKKSSLKKKRYLIQKGGFLEVLIPTVITTLVNLLTS